MPPGSRTRRSAHGIPFRGPFNKEDRTPCEERAENLSRTKWVRTVHAHLGSAIPARVAAFNPSFRGNPISGGTMDRSVTMV
jgi:hypothetical protein